jgi:hypothetical protein
MRRLAKRWWFWLTSVSLGVIVLAGLLTAIPNHTSLEAVARKVKVGMEKEEVDELLDSLGYSRGVGQRGWTYHRHDYHFWDNLDSLIVNFTQDYKVADVKIDRGFQIPLWQRFVIAFYYYKSELGW